MDKFLSLKIGKEQEWATVEQLLKRELGLSKKEISRAKFREKGICLNGEKVRVTEKGKEGDFLTVSFEEESPASDILLPKYGQLSILYEDEDLLIVDKPPMMPTQPSGCHERDSLCNLVYAYMLRYEKAPVVRPVGRLDQETSGTVVFAKNQLGAARLSAQRDAGAFQKTYYAFVSGKPAHEKGEICQPIGSAGEQQGRGRIKMRVCQNGKPAVTRYEILEMYEKDALMRIQIETGRTHQIRVHMKWLGHPLLGDQLYGMEESKDSGFQRAALHAGKVRLFHPFSGREILAEAPFPEDFISKKRTEQT